MTYVVEGFANYQLEGKPAEQLAQGSARLLTAASRTLHKVAPGEGGSVRWFNLVVGLPPSLDSPNRLQAPDSSSPTSYLDNVEVRPLTGPKGPMVAASGLGCDAMFFSRESTTFRSVGSEQRAVVYALAGQGAVNGRAMEAGEATLADGVSGVSVRGSEGFRAIFASVPKVSMTSAPARPMPQT